MNYLVRTIIGSLVFALALPAVGEVTDEDIRRARDEVNRVTEESAELGAAVTEAYGRQAALDQEIADLQSSIEFAQIEITETEARLEELAVELYMGTTSGASLSVLFSASDDQYPVGLEYLRQAKGVDSGVVTQLRGFRDELDRQTARLGEALDEQVSLAAELEGLASQLQEDLVAAQKVYDDLVENQRREEEERRRREEERRRRAAAAAEAAAAAAAATASAPGADVGSGDTTTSSPTSPVPPVITSGGTCPVAGAVSFSDSWGAPRSGGRSHKGVDMIAARGTPVVAIYSGRVQRLSNSSLGGKSVYFYSEAGDIYYYAHLDDWAGIRAGMSMSVGEVLGYVGSSGNAPEWLPHLHFEYHPGGGAAVNPYPLVKDLCG